jgi:hypothetical protein
MQTRDNFNEEKHKNNWHFARLCITKIMWFCEAYLDKAYWDTHYNKLKKQLNQCITNRNIATNAFTETLKARSIGGDTKAVVGEADDLFFAFFLPSTQCSQTITSIY